MKRYTVRAQMDTALFDTKVLSNTIEHEMSHTRYLYHIHSVNKLDNGAVLIELECEADRQGITKVFEVLAQRLNMQFEQLGWGWLLTGFAADGVGTESNLQFDSYIYISPQTAEEADYKYGLGMALIAILSGLGFLISLFLFVGGVLSSAYTMICFGILFSVGFGYVALSRISLIRCRKDKIEFRYWFRPSEEIQWNNILTLRFSRVPGEHFCIIEGLGKSVRLPLFWLEGRSTLIRTILDRASLLYVQGTMWESAVFKRFDAP